MKRQLPVYSPLSPSHILSATLATAKDGERERDGLAAELRKRFDASSVILTGSGTQALELALRHGPSTGAGKAPVVALPGYSCYDLVTAAKGAGVTVRFYDLDPRTLAPDLDSVRRTLRTGVSAVVAANLYGYPVGWGPLASECHAAGVALIEDAAQGIGTASEEGVGGALGAASVLSFGRGKGWTGGGGGALLLRGELASRLEHVALEAASSARSVRTMIQTGAAWALGRPGLYRIPTSVPGLGLGETHYKQRLPPRPIPAFSAALARRTADLAIGAVGDRRLLATRLIRALTEEPGHGKDFQVCEPVGGSECASFLRLPVVVDRAVRASVISGEGRSLGIASGYPTALHRLRQASSVLARSATGLPGCELLADGLVTLPTHRWVTPEDASALAAHVARGGEDPP